MKDIFIETERLILRPWRVEDAQDLYDYAQDPEVGLNAGWPPHNSVEDSRQLLESWVEAGNSEKNINLALVLKDTGKVIGSFGVGEDSRRPAPGIRIIGYALGKDYWGRGLMPEAARAGMAFAFKNLPIDLLSVTHFAGNHRSKRVIEKCGFRYEGTLRRAAPRFDGVVKDLCCYSITRKEFEEKNIL